MLVGLDRLPELSRLTGRLRGAKVGLLAHPASVDRRFVHAGDVLFSLGVEPSIYFGPEHGFGGEAQDMVGVADARHPATGAPIVSLYGDSFESLSPTADQLRDLDVLVIDLADVGARYYTFVWTALLAVRAAAKRGVHTVILDRPNPLGSEDATVEGNLPSKRFLSFVGLEPIPVRHGLTVGEIVACFAEKDGLPLGESGALSMVAAHHVPEEGAAGWDRPFVQPSPNMPTFDTALVYPGGCLIEGTNLSEGRGTTRPFELVGAPFLDGKELALRLSRSGLPGFVARPVTFLPMFHKHARTVCGGVQIHVTHRAAFRPYATYLALVGHALQISGSAFQFRTERYEFVDHIPAFDLLTGGDTARTRLAAWDAPEDVARSVAAPPAEIVELRDQARSAARSATIRT
jgi:uncharacterized protein YbbC (DUF1343 family)